MESEICACGHRYTEDELASGKYSHECLIWKVCPRCKGSKIIKPHFSDYPHYDQPKTCHICNGTGRVRRILVPDAFVYRIYEDDLFEQAGFKTPYGNTGYNDCTMMVVFGHELTRLNDKYWEVEKA